MGFMLIAWATQTRNEQKQLIDGRRKRKQKIFTTHLVLGKLSGGIVKLEVTIDTFKK